MMSINLCRLVRSTLGSDIWAKWSAILILDFNFIEHSQDAYFSKRVLFFEYHPKLAINLDAFDLGFRVIPSELKLQPFQRFSR